MEEFICKCFNYIMGVYDMDLPCRTEGLKVYNLLLFQQRETVGSSLSRSRLKKKRLGLGLV